MTCPRIAVTMGDAAGIGPEIVVKALQFSYQGVQLAVIGDATELQRTAEQLDLPWRVARLESLAHLPIDPSQHSMLHVGTLTAPVPVGRVSADIGAASHAYVERAIAAALAGQCQAIVTAPINKDAWSAAGVEFPGHTELLADRCGVHEFAMMLFNDELRVVLVSIHVPLNAAVTLVTLERELRTIRLAHEAATSLGIKRPRVAVAGLNPHAGENGKFGREDSEIIVPAVAAARSLGIDASGPWPGDTVFMRARRGDFDIVVAQYHDQGLIPIKYLGVDTGVNVTLGLPFVRTSVDHGTAFDIAGQGKADPSSLVTAIRHAARMVAAPLNR